MSGLPYGTPYEHCTACDSKICTQCYREYHSGVSDSRGRHNESIQITPQATLPAKNLEAVECSVCYDHVQSHLRIKVDDVTIATCHACFFQTVKEGFRPPEGNVEIVSVEMPHRIVKDRLRRSCQGCEVGISLTHCTRCLEAIGDGETVYECRDCMRESNGQGGSARFCEGCFESVQAKMVGHVFVSLKYQVLPLRSDGGDEAYFRVTCLECQRGSHPSALCHMSITDWCKQIGTELRHRSLVDIAIHLMASR